MIPNYFLVLEPVFSNLLYPKKEQTEEIIRLPVADDEKDTRYEFIADDFTKEGLVVEHDELPRLKEQKSLVDLRMVAKTCEVFYKDKVENLILATSDSDIWALIESLPSANILVLAEKNKVGDVLIEALTQKRIKYAFMEEMLSIEQPSLPTICFANASLTSSNVSIS